MTMISCQEAAAFSAETTSPIVAASSNAGITIDVETGSATCAPDGFFDDAVPGDRAHAREPGAADRLTA